MTLLIDKIVYVFKHHDLSRAPKYVITRLSTFSDVTVAVHQRMFTNCKRHLMGNNHARTKIPAATDNVDVCEFYKF